MLTPATGGVWTVVPGWWVRPTCPPRRSARRARSASVAARNTWGGLPTSTVPSGMTVPVGTSVPSPRMQPSPRREPGIRIAPLPISQRSPTRAPTTVARWPKIVRCPISTGCPGQPTRTPFSRTAEWLPSRTFPARDRSTTPWANSAPAPTCACPIRTAEAATSQAGCSGRGRLRLTGLGCSSGDDRGPDLSAGAHRLGDRGLLGDLGQLRALIVVERAVQHDPPVDPPGRPVGREVGQLDVGSGQRPLLALGVHPQGDRGTGTEPGQQQTERRRTGVPAAMRRGFVPAQQVAAALDAHAVRLL